MRSGIETQKQFRTHQKNYRNNNHNEYTPAVTDTILFVLKNEKLREITRDKVSDYWFLMWFSRVTSSASKIIDICSTDNEKRMDASYADNS